MLQFPSPCDSILQLYAYRRNRCNALINFPIPYLECVPNSKSLHVYLHRVLHVALVRAIRALETTALA